MKKLRITTKLLGLVLLSGLFACNDGDGSVSSKGQASLKVTDAAVNAENVNKVVLSVSEVQATSNGQVKTMATFDTPKEFNVMAYQNGETYFLGEGDLEAGTYSDVRLILSGASDSYIGFKDGSKKDLEVPSGTTSGYKIKGTFEVAANSTTDIVADIDLRKALAVTGEGTYKLRPTARLVVENTTGKIQGSVSGSIDASETIVVYAYKKGSFTTAEEAEPADGETRFQNSINSAVVAENGSYTLAFMEEGEYEIKVASFSNNDQDEELEYNSTLDIDLMISGTLFNSVEVESNSSVTAAIILK
jgi:hypothetical protein